jgi:hypothetical protein
MKFSKCLTCNKTYVGQTWWNLKLIYHEHIWYIRNNNQQSAYAMHILNHQQQYGIIQDTMDPIITTWKGTHMNCWESYYIQNYQQQNPLVEEQKLGELNPLCDILNDTSTQQNMPVNQALIHTACLYIYSVVYSSIAYTLHNDIW